MPRKRRPRGLGGVYLRPDKRLDVRTRDPATGRRVSRYLPADTPIKDGWALHGKILAGLEPARAVRTPKSDLTLPPAVLTVDTWLTEWLSTRLIRGLDPNSLRTYRWAAGTIRPVLGRVPLASLTRAQVQRHFDEMAAAQKSDGSRRFGPTAVHLAHATLRTALREAVRLGHIPANPAADVALAPKVKPSRAGMDATRMRQIVAACRETPLDGPVALAALLGLRVSEALGLQRADIEEGVIRIRGQLDVDGRTYKPQTKGRKARTLPLLPDAAAAIRRAELRAKEDRLRAGPAYTDRGFLFTGPTGEPLTQHWTGVAFKRAQVAAGLEPVSFHWLRHGCAALLRSLGIDITIRKAILGHMSDESAEGYGAVDLEELAAALSAAARRLALEG